MHPTLLGKGRKKQRRAGSWQAWRHVTGTWTGGGVSQAGSLWSWLQRLPSSSQLLAVKLAEDLQEKKALTWWNPWVKGRWETTDCASAPSQRQGPREQSDG